MNASLPDKRRTHDLPKRVLFLNDVGFQYGAGVAQSRQLECILALGIEAGVLTWAKGAIDLEPVATRKIDSDLWLGIHEVNALECGKTLSDDAVINGLLREVARFKPEIVIVGNLHAARWPLRLLTALRAIGCRVLTFVHDAYLFTGRCAYPGNCTLYLTGCNDTCPTASHYPALQPSLIAGAWHERRAIFGGPDGIEVIANSLWSKKMFLTAMPTCGHIETIELGANEDVFKPGDKLAARQHLGLPTDRPIVLCAAVNFQEERKGGPQLREIVAALQGEVVFAAFGHNAAQEIPGLIGLGYHLGAHQLALAYQAADLFLSTATEEAFGQTIMEAQLCGVPAIAFHAGGVAEIIRNEITGRLVRNGDAGEAIAAIRSLLADARFMKVAGPWARQYAVARFSGWAHEERWHVYLAGHTLRGTGHNPPSLAYPLNDTVDHENLALHRPSWPGADTPDGFLAEDHRLSFERTSHIPGWQTPGDTFKLYEMGYHAGDVILEIGSFGGRSATAALRGALANRARNQRPAYYGIDIEADSIARTRGYLASENLGSYCNLFHGVLADFVQRWSITPTMVFLDGDHSYAGVKKDLALLRDYVRAGTPILVHDYLNDENRTGKIGVRRAADEWASAGHGRFMGCHGCCALYLLEPAPARVS